MAAPLHVLTWGYGESDGPAHWSDVAPASLGSSQSPINIIPSVAEYDKDLVNRPLEVTYSAGHCRHVQNNGHSVQISVDDGRHSRLVGGPLQGEHLLKQFHFHWGSDSFHGSEHRIDDKVYAAELHLVHWNSSKYNSFDEAVHDTRGHGLTVLAVFIESGAAHVGLKTLTDLLPEIPFSEDELDIGERGFDASCLLPGDLSKYWTYCGSLTTPPCLESVRFIVFKEPIQISEEQLEAFRSLRPRPYTRSYANRDRCHGYMVDNFRPLQPLNGRVVKSSFRKFFA